MPRGRFRERPFERWFWSRVAIGPGCWLWMGATNNYGYGVLRLDGGRLGLAHRSAYLLAWGSIPDDLEVLHHCDVPACCRPSDLFAGTQADNVADMVAKGRDRPYLSSPYVRRDARGRALERV